MYMFFNIIKYFKPLRIKIVLYLSIVWAICHKKFQNNFIMNYKSYISSLILVNFFEN